MSIVSSVKHIHSSAEQRFDVGLAALRPIFCVPDEVGTKETIAIVVSCSSRGIYAAKHEVIGAEVRISGVPGPSVRIRNSNFVKNLFPGVLASDGESIHSLFSPESATQPPLWSSITYMANHETSTFRGREPQ